MSRFAALIVDAWYSKNPWLWLLSPLSLVFYLTVIVRRQAYKRGLFNSWRGTVPVIVVGNIAVGGTGKTPLVIALAQRLLAAGYSPGIASRGYGAQPPYTPFLVTADTDVKLCGDEPLLIVHRSGVPVMIDPVRANACQQLISAHGCDVILTDDGLQHYAIQRDIEFVVLDGKRGLGNHMVLPMGPLREPPSRLNAVDFVVANSASDQEIQPLSAEISRPVNSMQICPRSFIALRSGEERALDNWPGKTTVHAVAGIGNPQRFFHSLRELGFTLVEHAFSDHHAFTAADLHFDDDLPVIMTEKDAVKCQSFAQDGRCWFLKVSAELDDAFYQRILERLDAIGTPTQQSAVD